METPLRQFPILDLMVQPAFCVKDGTIAALNQAAKGLLLSPGTEVSTLLPAGAGEEYAAFQGGCLYLPLSLSGVCYGATVTRTEDGDIFLLDSEDQDPALQALALASRELRQPLGNLIAIAGNLLPQALPDRDEKSGALLAQLSRSLYQMERILGNMADAGQTELLFHPEYRNISCIFDEIFGKATALLAASGATLHYQGLKTDVSGLIDEDLMERAVLNLLSNAVKFSGPGAVIQASLSRRGSVLILSITDGGGTQPSPMGSLFSRYLRQPGLEDSRFGLGLGMVLVRSAALRHGGTVLIDQPEGAGTRVTMTLGLKKEAPSQLRSPITELSGGRDRALIELSEVLPLSVYQKEL